MLIFDIYIHFLHEIIDLSSNSTRKVAIVKKKNLGYVTAGREKLDQTKFEARNKILLALLSYYTN